MWWREIIDWLSFETSSSSLRNFGISYMNVRTTTIYVTGLFFMYLNHRSNYDLLNLLERISV